MPALDERSNAIHILGERVFACDEVSQRPPQSFVHRNDGRKLHQMLYRRDRFGIASMNIKITVSHWKDRPADSARQTPWSAKLILRIVGRSPNGIACSTDSTLERSKNLRQLV